MPRAQVIVVRDDRVLMVRHRQHGLEWWCLPGGGIKSGETPEAAALRELREECNVRGAIVRQTSSVHYGPDDTHHTFLVDIGGRVPSLGCDPEVPADEKVLIDVRWLRLREIPERDRAFLFAAGLIGTGGFLREIERWGDRTSYPVGGR